MSLPGPSKPQLLTVPAPFRKRVETLPQISLSRRRSLFIKPRFQPKHHGKHHPKRQDVNIVVEMVDDLKKKREADSRKNSGNFVINPSKNIPSCELLKVTTGRRTSIVEELIDGKKKTDQEILELLITGQIPPYKLEDVLRDEMRAVFLRRAYHGFGDKQLQEAFKSIPYKSYEYYSHVKGVCCENVIGIIPLTMYALGPLRVNGTTFPVIPLATNDVKLMKTVLRGIKALSVNGVHSYVYGDGISRGPVVQMPTAACAVTLGDWLNVPENFYKIQMSFEDTSRFLRLTHIKVRAAGRLCFLRFVARTGDAMGMNMISKGTSAALNTLKRFHPEMEVISVSGNYCIDKKPSALNWIEGRGKSVVSEAVVPAVFIEETLKTTAEAMAVINHKVNLIGSTVSGSIGGFNTNAAGVLAAIFAATGQDVAQVIEGSHCMTVMECIGNRNEDLFISVTMPAVEVGTVGGGTSLPPQKSCLKLLGIHGPAMTSPGDNARILAQVIGATVLAGELASVAAFSKSPLVQPSFLDDLEESDQDSKFSLEFESDSDADLESESESDDDDDDDGDIFEDKDDGEDSDGIFSDGSMTPRKSI